MSTTDNGWPASKTLATRPLVINGTEFVGGIADRDDVERVLRYALQRVADEVEAPVNPGCWGFSFRPNRNDPSALSRHSGGIAVDLNAPTNPNGVPTERTWTMPQILEIHWILDDLDRLCGLTAGDRVVRWGGDFNGTPDSMHFEVNVTPTQLPALAARLRDNTEALMVTDDDKQKITDIVRTVLREELAAFAKTAGETIKVDGDGDPSTAKVSLERKLQNLS